MKNLDLLVKVTHEEDFALMAKIQHNLDSGMMPHVNYGRIEASLIHLHQSINRALDEGTNT